MARPYRRLNEPSSYWTIRVPDKLKKRARALARRLGISPAEIARNGINKELDLLERENKKIRARESR